MCESSVSEVEMLRFAIFSSLTKAPPFFILLSVESNSPFSHNTPYKLMPSFVSHRQLLIEVGKILPHFHGGSIQLSPCIPHPE